MSRASQQWGAESYAMMSSESRCLFSVDLLNGAFYSETVHKPAELLNGKFPGFIRSPGPLETVAGIKSFCQQEHAVPLKDQTFDAVGTVPAEEEQCAFFSSIQPIIQFDISCKARDPHPEVDASTAYDYA